MFHANVGGSAGLWWVYFDRGADEAARVIAASADPGRIGRTPYHLIHPIVVAGIIVVAAADVVVLGPLGLAVPALPALGLGLCAAVVALAVAALDYRVYRGK